MTLDPKHVLAPILALAILAFIGFQTSDALRHSGVWGQKARPRRVVAADPYAKLEADLAAPPRDAGLVGTRDPFTYGHAPAPTKRVVVKPPPPAPKPILTGVLMDNDPRAFIRYKDRNYTVKAGDLFAEFKVVRITAQQVELDHNGEQVMLVRPTRGD